MRDGEQSPGASMSLEEKLQISRVFDELGVDIIEAGFPIASPGDYEAVTEISKTLKRSIPAGLARATKKDIDACNESLRHAKNFRIHTFISTSPLHMKPREQEKVKVTLNLPLPFDRQAGQRGDLRQQIQASWPQWSSSLTASRAIGLI